MKTYCVCYKKEPLLWTLSENRMAAIHVWFERLHPQLRSRADKQKVWNDSRCELKAMWLSEMKEVVKPSI